MHPYAPLASAAYALLAGRHHIGAMSLAHGRLLFLLFLRQVRIRSAILLSFHVLPPVSIPSSSSAFHFHEVQAQGLTCRCKPPM